MSNRKIVVLGTGGTIAGLAVPGSAAAYRAGERGIADLVAAAPVPAMAGMSVVSEQLAQIDSKDLALALWQQLAARVGWWLAQDETLGVVVTHGTDTAEETAYFLQALLQPAKPVVLTCAMLPADHPEADGPQNLADAIAVAATPGARGVSLVCAGTLHSAVDVQKLHSWKLDAFSSGDAGPLGQISAGTAILVRHWPLASMKPEIHAIEKVVSAERWPRVEIVLNHAGADGAGVRALVRDGAQGIVVAGTGNGTLHQDLEAALLQAQATGVRVLRSTRCAYGGVRAGAADALASAGSLSPVKARIALMLELLAR